MLHDYLLSSAPSLAWIAPAIAYSLLGLSVAALLAIPIAGLLGLRRKD